MTEETKTTERRKGLGIRPGMQVGLVDANRLARENEPKVGTPAEAKALVDRYTEQANGILSAARAQAKKIVAAAKKEAADLVATAKRD